MQNQNSQPNPSPGGQDQQPEMNFRRYWHIISERRWLALTAFLSTVLLAGLYLVRAEKIYQATTRLQIDREPANVLNMQDVFSLDSGEQDYLQTQFKNLQSHSLIRSVIQQLNLEKDARYGKADDPVAAVLADLAIAPIRMSRLVDIRVQHPNPKQAESIANTLVRSFIDENMNQKIGVSTNAETWLGKQVANQKILVQQAEDALQKYRSQHNQVSLEQGDSLSRQALQQAQAELGKVRAESIQLQRVLSDIEKTLKTNNGLDSVPEIAANETISKLKQEIATQEAALAGLLKRYRDKYPKVVQARAQVATLKSNLNAEAANIMQSIRTTAMLAKGKEEELFKMVKEEEQKQMTLNSLRIQYEVLNRDAENAKSLYTTLLTRHKETQLTASLHANNMRVVDPAVATAQPVKPSIPLTIFMGIVGGVVVAFGLVFFVSYMDDSIKSQDDVETYLRLPFLAYVPNIKTNSVFERNLQAHVQPQSSASEAFRTVRATVSLTHRAENLHVVSVSSTIPGEGKSLVASNYAIVTAQTGQRTLIVDVDLRRPSVHKGFQLHSPIGLSSYLQGDVDDLEKIVHHSDVPNLDVICCGSLPANPSELIGSKRMREFLDLVKSKYDKIILDCPPISAVSDPLMVAALSDGIIFVNKFNKIRREHARRSVQRLQDSGIFVLGVVINDIDFEGKDSYYYSYYYYQNRYYADYKEKDQPKKRGEKGEKAVKA